MAEHCVESSSGGARGKKSVPPFVQRPGPTSFCPAPEKAFNIFSYSPAPLVVVAAAKTSSVNISSDEFDKQSSSRQRHVLEVGHAWSCPLSASGTKNGAAGRSPRIVNQVVSTSGSSDRDSFRNNVEPQNDELVTFLQGYRENYIKSSGPDFSSSRDDRVAEKVLSKRSEQPASAEDIIWRKPHPIACAGEESHTKAAAAAAPPGNARRIKNISGNPFLAMAGSGYNDDAIISTRTSTGGENSNRAGCGLEHLRSPGQVCKRATPVAFSIKNDPPVKFLSPNVHSRRHNNYHKTRPATRTGGGGERSPGNFFPNFNSPGRSITLCKNEERTIHPLPSDKKTDEKKFHSVHPPSTTYFAPPPPPLPRPFPPPRQLQECEQHDHAECISSAALTRFPPPRNSLSTEDERDSAQVEPPSIAFTHSKNSGRDVEDSLDVRGSGLDDQHGSNNQKQQTFALAEGEDIIAVVQEKSCGFSSRTSEAVSAQSILSNIDCKDARPRNKQEDAKLALPRE